MSEREWNVANRARIDARIISQCPNVRMPITDKDRALWVDNDAELYFARRTECGEAYKRNPSSVGVYWSKVQY